MAYYPITLKTCEITKLGKFYHSVKNMYDFCSRNKVFFWSISVGGLKKIRIKTMLVHL